MDDGYARRPSVGCDAELEDGLRRPVAKRTEIDPNFDVAAVGTLVRRKTFQFRDAVELERRDRTAARAKHVARGGTVALAAFDFRTNERQRLGGGRRRRPTPQDPPPRPRLQPVPF